MQTEMKLINHSHCCMMLLSRKKGSSVGTSECYLYILSQRCLSIIFVCLSFPSVGSFTTFYSNTPLAYVQLSVLYSGNNEFLYVINFIHDTLIHRTLPHACTTH